MKSLLSYTLVLIIASQSIIALADAHQAHQSGLQHLSFEHEHEHNQTSLIDSATIDFELVQSSVRSENSNSSFDCHHCCHCHGVHPVWMVSNLVITSPPLATNTESTFLFFLPSVIQEKLLRPPIS